MLSILLLLSGRFDIVQSTLAIVILLAMRVHVRLECIPHNLHSYIYVLPRASGHKRVWINIRGNTEGLGIGNEVDE